MLDIADLVDRCPPQLAHPFGDAVHPVDVGLAELPTVRVHRKPSADLDGTEIRLGSAAFCNIADDPAFTEAQRLGASTICLRAGTQQAVFIVHQSLRPGARETIGQLAARGMQIRILSGDHPAAVAQIAQALGVEHWQGGMTPAEKVAVLEEMKTQGRHVLMVGDGINDAPSLAAAHVSMSPITAADLSQAQADAVFLGERLNPVFETLMAARKARHLMHQNLWLTTIYNAVAVPIAIAGFVTPLIAAVAMSGSSLIVTLNALRARGAAGTTSDAKPNMMPDAATASIPQQEKLAEGTWTS